MHMCCLSVCKCVDGSGARHFIWKRHSQLILIHYVSLRWPTEHTHTHTHTHTNTHTHTHTHTLCAAPVMPGEEVYTRGGVGERGVGEGGGGEVHWQKRGRKFWCKIVPSIKKSEKDTFQRM